MTTLFISHSSKDKTWAEKIYEALQVQGYQYLFLDSHPDDGIVAGEDWEKALYHRLRQSRGVVVLCTANWLDSPWCVAEAMMARERGKPVFILATADVRDGRQVKALDGSERLLRMPDFLKDTQFIPLAGPTMAEEDYRRLWQGLKKVMRPQDRFPLPERPYPGLEPFQKCDAAVFFGRDDEIQQVESVLTHRQRNDAKGFILILGASGCGKSSLVRAGVLPRLEGTGGEKAVGTWVITPPFAGGKGLEGLAVSLANAFKEAGQPLALSAIRQRLEPARQGEGGMASAARALRELSSELMVARGVAEGHVLLVLDQLEEVFGTAPSSEAHAMLQLLLEASADEASFVVILATMRSDFLNAFQLFPSAAGHYEYVTLDPMPRSRFGELIEGPAQRFGFTLGAGLTERLVEDTRYDDALPLLAFTLERLYVKGYEDGVLKLEEYQDLFPAVKIQNEDGTTTEYRGVSAAIKHVADEILDQAGYARLPADASRLRDLRRAFHCLAQVGEGRAAQFTRRTALWSHMPDSCEAVLNQFVRQRLLVSGAEHGERTLNVAHEALFRVWDTLRLWLVQDRKALTLRDQIEDAALEWETEGRAKNRQWSNERIIEAVDKIGRSGVSLDDMARPEVIRTFLGPTDLDELVTLLSLGEEQDSKNGSGLYGDEWRLPLCHEARATVGVRLAILGDRRPGVGLRADGLPDIKWCRIEASEVTIQIRSNPNDPNSEVIDTLKRPVKTFSLARYPITVTQFQSFCEDCYQNGKWQLPPGGPVGLLVGNLPPYHRARHGNHPADSVSWWDAVAFCHWLSRRLSERCGTDVEVRLPTEFEWQLAATGGDPGRTYPWGPDWDSQREPWRANTYESRLGRSTAVGMYPAGVSQAGVLDMAGTIWEWCLNAFDHEDDIGFPETRADRRVVRGGSWYHNRMRARCTDRLRFYPHFRGVSIGFRVLCSSPPILSIKRDGQG